MNTTLHRVDESRLRRLALAVVLAALTLLAYLPALGAGYIWDDDWHVTNNPTLRTLDGLRQIWLVPSRPGQITIPQYYPLTHTTFWIEYHLWGLRPAGYHLTNVLLHAGSALLLWRILLRLGVPAAWFAAAIWAVHPVNVESVAWISERKNTLSGFFYLAAFASYWRYVDPPALNASPDRDAAGRAHLQFYFLSLSLFFCALWSTTVTSTLPAAILLIIWWKRGRITWRDAAALIPFFLAGAAAGSVTSWMEQNVVGATGADWNFSIVERILIAGRAAVFYAATLLFPFALSFNYERWDIDPGQRWQWLFPAGALLLTAILAHRALNRRQKSADPRGALTAWLFFLGTLAPALGFFNVYPMRYEFVADHFQYLASIGPVALATAAVWHLTQPKRARRRRPVPAIPAIPVIFVLTLATLTWARARVFHDPESLWRDTLAKNPRSWMAHQNFGNYLVEQDRLDEAEHHFQQAAAIKPDHVESRLRLAAVAVKRGQYEEAEAFLRKAIAVQPRYEPGSIDYRETAVPVARLAMFLADRGRHEEAIAAYRQALAIAPGYPLATTNLANLHNRIGMILFQSGRPDEALAHFQAAVEVHPASPEAHNNLGIALAAAGRVQQAERAYRAALALDPDFAPAQRNLARLLSGGQPQRYDPPIP